MSNDTKPNHLQRAIDALTKAPTNNKAALVQAAVELGQESTKPGTFIAAAEKVLTRLGFDESTIKAATGKSDEIKLTRH